MIDPMLSARNLFDLSYRDVLLIKLDLINREVFSTFSLKMYVKEIFRYRQIEQLNDWFGYSPRNGSILNKVPLFLEKEDIQYEVRSNQINLEVYRKGIDFLIQKGIEKNVEIVFFLPMTYDKQSEKDIVIPLINSLDSKNKLEFTDGFIKEMSDPVLLFDRNHYNQQGGKKYTELLIKEITKRNKQ